MPDVNPKGHWKKKCRKCPRTCPSSCLFFIYLLELTAVLHYGAIQHHYPSAEFLSVLSLALSSSSLCRFSVRQLPRVGRRKSCSGCWGLCTCLISFTVACLPPSGTEERGGLARFFQLSLRWFYRHMSGLPFALLFATHEEQWASSAWWGCDKVVCRWFMPGNDSEVAQPFDSIRKGGFYWIPTSTSPVSPVVKW